ncbi:MAG: DegV family protein [Clostridia bacterium]|nr:DegV family protein [Clostridia bacterium]MDD3231774.1 DegV family protein [Clostridia bacterium]MDD3862529.1 DegV family protein [Clostridia bacterium]
MKNIKLISDGACDLSKDEAKKLNISLVNFWINVDDETLCLESDELYEMMKNKPNSHFKTACPSILEYITEFEKAIKQKQTVLCICIATKFSGSFDSATVAKTTILEKYPNAEIHVIDSRMCSASQNLLVKSIASMIEEGYSIDKILKTIETLKEETKIYLTVKNLDYLRAGGRIGNLSSILLNILAIKPIIVMENGDVKSGGKGLGIGMTLQKIINDVKKWFEHFRKDIEEFRFYVGYSTDKNLAKNFFTNVINKLKLKKSDVELNQIGSTAAVHTGPETIGISFMRKYKTIK